MLAMWVLVFHLVGWGRLTAAGTSSVLLTVDSWLQRLFMSHGETHPAVVVFIVLSGYCIHRNGCRLDAWSTRRYAIKRVFRIWPVYVAAALTGAGLHVLATHQRPNGAIALTRDTVITAKCMGVKLSAIAAFVPSLYKCGMQGNSPLVTVMVEMWLYVFYALAAVFVLRRAGDRALTAIVVVGYCTALALAAPNPTTWGWFFNGSFFGFLPYWWLGAAAIGCGTAMRRTGIAVGACLWVSTLFVGGRSVPVAELHKLGLALVACCVIANIDAAHVKLPALLTTFGRSGYSLYAFHAPILIVLMAVGAGWPIVLGTAVAGGLVVYVVYERPLMVFGRSLADREPEAINRASRRAPRAPDARPRRRPGPGRTSRPRGVRDRRSAATRVPRAA